MVRWAGAAFIMTGIAGAACVKWSRSQFASVIVLAADRVAFAMVFKFFFFSRSHGIRRESFRMQYLQASRIRNGQTCSVPSKQLVQCFREGVAKLLALFGMSKAWTQKQKNSTHLNF